MHKFIGAVIGVVLMLLAISDIKEWVDSPTGTLLGELFIATLFLGAACIGSKIMDWIKKENEHD